MLCHLEHVTSLTILGTVTFNHTTARFFLGNLMDYFFIYPFQYRLHILFLLEKHYSDPSGNYITYLKQTKMIHLNPAVQQKCLNTHCHDKHKNTKTK